MHTTHKLILILVAISLLIPFVYADGNYTASRGLTANGPYNILVSLGIETTVPDGWYQLFYNWIAILMIVFITAMASQRNARFFCILIPMVTALVTWFGWLKTDDPTKLWGIIIGSALLSVAIYMKDTNKEKWGSGGPGSTLINFVFFMIILQACVGLVNTTGIWEENASPTPDQYQNVDLQSQMGGLSNTGGFWENLQATAAILVTTGIMALKTILSIILTIAAFSVALYLIYPMLYGSVLAVAIIGVVQVVVWLLYAWLFFQLVYKPMPDGGYI